MQRRAQYPRSGSMPGDPRSLRRGFSARQGHAPAWIRRTADISASMSSQCCTAPARGRSSSRVRNGAASAARSDAPSVGLTESSVRNPGSTKDKTPAFSGAVPMRRRPGVLVGLWDCPQNTGQFFVVAVVASSLGKYHLDIVGYLVYPQILDMREQS